LILEVVELLVEAGVLGFEYGFVGYKGITLGFECIDLGLEVCEGGASGEEDFPNFDTEGLAESLKSRDTGGVLIGILGVQNGVDGINVDSAFL
jgi:hypothetical protein